MDTKFARKNPHFDFHAGQLMRDIVIPKFRHAKAIHALKMTRVALTAHWGKTKKIVGSHLNTSKIFWSNGGRINGVPCIIESQAY